MAAKFNIFVDSPQPTQPTKCREPLGLRQRLVQPVQQIQPPPPPPPPRSPHHEEDQENDISMVSLGSEYVPSIFQDSFESEDEDYYLEDDEKLRVELNEAFKQNDDSQLFKSAQYIDDIQTYLYQIERTPDLRALPNYMDFQLDINSDKRSILINWLVEITDEYDLQSETLFICINIIDRFLSKMSLPTSNFQLLGVSAMFIASKYEEIYPPYLYQFVEVTDHTYTGREILKMEQEILRTLNFRISTPTISYFLRQIFAYNKFSKKVYHLSEYLCYLSLLADQPFLEYYASEIALAAVILAAVQLGVKESISPDLKSAFDKSNQDQLRRRTTRSQGVDRRVFIVNQNLPFCIEALRAIQERVTTESAIYHRFSSESHNCVSLLTAPTVEELLDNINNQ